MLHLQLMMSRPWIHLFIFDHICLIHKPSIGCMKSSMARLHLFLTHPLHPSSNSLIEDLTLDHRGKQTEKNVTCGCVLHYVALKHIEAFGLELQGQNLHVGCGATRVLSINIH